MRERAFWLLRGLLDAQILKLFDGAETLKSSLAEHLRFRHLFRNIYGFDLKWERCQPLAERLGGTFGDLREQIDRFEFFRLYLIGQEQHNFA